MTKKPLEKFINTLPKKVKFCTRCVVSNQRPRIKFDQNGVCSACTYLDYKNQVIDWNVREAQLQKLVNKIKKKTGEWDILVPGSGGKDSGFVAHLLKHKYNLNPLCVTWSPNKYTPIGFQNFNSFVDSGFLTINCFGNGKINRLLSRLCFEEIGDNFTPFTMGQHSFVYHIAQKLNISTVMFGEGAEVEYGGDVSAHIKGSHSVSENARLYWKGNTVRDLVKFGIKNKKYFKGFNSKDPDLNFYEPPKNINKKIKMFHMSYFLNWKPQENYYYTFENTGFRPNKERSEGTYSKYASLDDQFDGLHYYMMFIKFGIGRATSDAAHEVRDGLITRQDAVKLVEKYDSEFPKKYFRETIDYLGVSEKEFFNIVDSFRPKHIWKKVKGKWKLRHTVGRKGTDD